MNTNFKVIGLTRLGIKLEFTAAEADTLTTRPSKLSFVLYPICRKINRCNLYSNNSENITKINLNIVTMGTAKGGKLSHSHS